MTSQVATSQSHKPTLLPLVYVLYGSETGNARSAALHIVRKFRGSNMDCRFCCLNDFWTYMQVDDMFKEQRDEKQLAIFVVSTTGQGDVPTNMQRFWRGLLSAALLPTYLSNLSFTVFGLGDSRYPQFNVVARKLATRLKQLGGTEFFRLGLGDEQHDFGYEGEFDPWCTMLSDLLGLQEIPPGWIAPPDFHVESTAESASQQEEHGSIHVPYRQQLGTSVFYGRVTSKTRLTSPDHFQDVRHIQIELPPGIVYQPGDALSIHPVLPRALSHHFIVETLQRRPEEAFFISLSKTSCLMESPFDAQHPLTLEQIFNHYLDLTAIPDRYFFYTLGHFASDVQQREKLLEMAGSSLESKDAYYEYCKSERRTVAEVLWDFHSARQIPLDHLLSIIPVLRPRAYSCASSQYWYSRNLWWALAGDIIPSTPLIWGSAAPWMQLHCCLPESSYQEKGRGLFRFRRRQQRTSLAKRILETWGRITWCSTWEQSLDHVPNFPTSVDLCVACVEFKTKLQRTVLGTCSQYLRDISEGACVAMSIQPGLSFGSLRSIDPVSPLLLICPGTGVAPCRALVQRRFLEWLGRCRDSRTTTTQGFSIPGDIIVALGLRHPQKDFLFLEEWQRFQELSAWSPWPLPWTSVKNERMSNLLVPLSRWLFSSTSVPRPLWRFGILAAFSRWSPDIKVYVQEALEQHGPIIARHVSCQETIVVISGRSHPMPSQVRRALEDILTDHKGMSHEEAVHFWDLKRRRGELIYDTWG